MSYYQNKPRYQKRRPAYGGGYKGGQKRSTPKQRRGQYIDPARFVKKASPSAEQAPYEPTHTFADFNLHELISKNLAKKGYVTPSPIQDQTIPLILDGTDIIGIANTGTGKTGAFGIPVLHQLIADANTKALIVAPTRELAQQIDAELRSIGRGADLDGALLIGGSSMGQQLRDLRYNPRIVMGTPGRIKDHLERGSLKLTDFNLVVLDEVDRMLDMGFVNDMRDILSQLAPQSQSLFFSATIDRRVSDLIQTFSNNPVTVSIKSNESSNNVNQDVVRYASVGDKIETLHALLQNDDIIKKAILFDETQRGVERLSKSLVERGFKADSIHGGKSQGQRQRALKRFKNNEVTILVATDVAARGIDVPDISHVINYSIPQTYEDYIHRIGRTGRAGQTGHALTFIDR